MASSAVFPACRLVPRSRRHYRAYIKVVAIIFNWLSLIVPFGNLHIYLKIKSALLASPHHKAQNPMTFNGRPDKGANTKGSTVNFEDLCQFYDPAGETEPLPKGKKPEMRLNPATVQPESREHLAAYA